MHCATERSAPSGLSARREEGVTGPHRRFSTDVVAANFDCEALGTLGRADNWSGRREYLQHLQLVAAP